MSIWTKYNSHGFQPAKSCTNMAHEWAAEEMALEQMNKILVVDDELGIRGPLGDYLSQNGFEPHLAKDAADARSQMADRTFDLVVLDVMMPGEDGLSLCRFIRETYDTPIVMLTARSEETDRIVGLEIGADDYVAKPFNPRELVARIKAVLRRSISSPKSDAQDAAKLIFAGWTLDTHARTLMDPEGISVALSTGEYELLHILLMRPHTVLPRDRLLDLSRGREADVFDRSIDNMISRLRRKIEANPKDPVIIKTIWGGGYMLAADVEAQ